MAAPLNDRRGAFPPFPATLKFGTAVRHAVQRFREICFRCKGESTATTVIDGRHHAPQLGVRVG